MSLKFQIVKAVQAVEAVQKAKPRIEKPLRPGVTFFSENDVWLFQESFSVPPPVCNQCTTAARIAQFRGNNLRLNFPYLEIVDENTILPHVHPNCRCVLVRVIGKVGKV